MAKAPILKATTLAEDRKQRLYALLENLSKSSAAMAKAKQDNDAARAALCTEFFPQLSEGTSTAMLEFGKKLVITQPIYRKVDAAALDAAIVDGKLSASLLASVVKYDPKVSVSAWKELSDDERKMFGDIVSEAPGAVSFKIEDAK